MKELEKEKNRSSTLKGIYLMLLTSLFIGSPIVFFSLLFIDLKK